MGLEYQLPKEQSRIKAKRRPIDKDGEKVWLKITFLAEGVGTFPYGKEVVLYREKMGDVLVPGYRNLEVEPRKPGKIPIKKIPKEEWEEIKAILSQVTEGQIRFWEK